MTKEQLADVSKSIPIRGEGSGPNRYELIIGGSSKDGIPLRQQIPVEE